MKNIYLELKELVNIISEELKEEIKIIKSKIKIASIIVGNDPASLSYLTGMKKRAEKINLDIEIIQMDIKIKENELIKKIESLNKNKNISGIIVQVPLPKHINFHNIAMSIDYNKDIDGINPYNQGLLFAGKPFLIPATALAVSLTLKYISKKYSYNLEGKTACIIGRSLTVGKPLIHLLLGLNITPAIIHTKTTKPESISSKSDIIVAACGSPELIKSKWIKRNSIVIDVGIHSIEDDSEKGCKLCGDIDRKAVIKKAKILTAVPGGIGSVTSILIFTNALKSYYKINKNTIHNFNFEK